MFVLSAVVEECNFLYLYETRRLLLLICCGGEGLSMVQVSELKVVKQVDVVVADVTRIVYVRTLYTSEVSYNEH